MLKHEENETVSTISITSRGESFADIPARRPHNMPRVPGALLPVNRLGLISSVLQRYGKQRSDSVARGDTRAISKNKMSKF